jgi:hypothetical protein
MVYFFDSNTSQMTQSREEKKMTAVMFENFGVDFRAGCTAHQSKDPLVRCVRSGLSLPFKAEQNTGWFRSKKKIPFRVSFLFASRALVNSR